MNFESITHKMPQNHKPQITEIRLMQQNHMSPRSKQGKKPNFIGL